MKFKKNLYLAYLLVFNIVFGSTLLLTFFPIYLAENGISLVSIGIIYGISAFLAAILRFPIGYALDKYGKKSLLITGSLIYPLFAIGILIAKTAIEFTLLKIFLEIFGAIFWTSFSAYLYSVISKGKEGQGLAGSNALVMIAAGTAPLLAGFLIDSYGFDIVFYLGALVSFIGVLVGFFVKEIKNKINFRLKKSIVKEYKDLFKNKRVKLSLMIGAIVSIYGTIWYTYLPIYLEGQGFSLSFIGFLASFNLLLCALAQPLEGKLIDKFPINYIIIPGFFIMGFFGYVFVNTLNKIYLVASRAILGVGADLAWNPMAADMARFADHTNRGAINALIQFVTTSSAAISIMVAGYIADSFGIRNMLLASVTISAIFGILAALHEKPEIIKLENSLKTTIRNMKKIVLR